ncbi:MAG TPA: GTPase domain-containing protein [Gemmata sp.]|jgi:hypothetical protein|nr:GTPase domain-containing protein [Gemmata sp.]
MTLSSALSTSDPTIPQVLLFGHSGAGKSALLGGLFQAGEIQGETLLGEIIEPSGRLSSLRDAVYSGKELEKTHAELTSYTVRIRPRQEGTRTVGKPLSIVLHDCSGKAAESLIRHPSSLRDPETHAPLSRSVLDADAILLLVNGSADENELSAAFVEFHAFLSIVAQGKASAREVGGFPIFLVLTQCDKLARPGDTRAMWEERVRDRCEQAWDKFHSFLKDATHEDDSPSPFLPFGSIELIVHGVAIRQPRLVDAPGQPSTPFRIAELFRESFAAAQLHQERENGSDHRLKWTLRYALGFVATMILGSFGMTFFRPSTIDSQLADRVAAYRMHEPLADVRLVEPNLTRNKQTLASFHGDPGYFSLRDDLKEFIDSRLQEIDDYKRYRDKLNSTTIPRDTRTLEELAQVEQSLRDELAVPAIYSWEGTPAAALREKWLADVQAIGKAENTFLEYYRNFIRVGTALTLTTSFGGNWRADVNSLLEKANRLPAVLNEPLSGSRSLTSKRGEAVANRVPYEFERVYQARKDWDTTSNTLIHLRDLADALGLTAGLVRPEPLLVLPEPAPGIDSVSLPAARWTALKRKITYISDDFREWSTNDFPDPGRSILSERLESNFKAGLRHVKALILARMDANLIQKDTPESGRKLADTLTDSTTPFPDWGRLLQLYVRLREPAARNPVLELAEFLRTKSFTLSPRGFDLVIPADLSSEKVVPNGAISLSILHPGSVSETRRFKQIGEGERNGSTTTYRFIAEGEGKLIFVPGDTLQAALPMISGTQELKLIWEGGSSRAYPFDLPSREPRLQKPNGTSEPALGVKLSISSGSDWPRIPILLSELRR